MCNSSCERIYHEDHILVYIHKFWGLQVTCGGTPDNVFPNNVFGYGIISVLKSIISLITAQ